MLCSVVTSRFCYCVLFCYIISDKEHSRLDALTYLRGKIDFLKWIFSLAHSKIRTCLTHPKISLSKNFETLCKLARYLKRTWWLESLLNVSHRIDCYRLMLLVFTQDEIIVNEMKRVRLNFLTDSCLEIFTAILDVVCVHYSAKLEHFLNFLGK